MVWSLAMMMLPNTRHTPAPLGYWGQCNFRHLDKNACCQTQQTDTRSQARNPSCNLLLFYELEPIQKTKQNKKTQYCT